MAPQEEQNQQIKTEAEEKPQEEQKSTTKRVQLATGEWEELPTSVADEYIKFRDLAKSINGGKIEERIAKIEQRANEEAEAKLKAQYEKKIQEAGSSEEIRKLLEEQYSAQLKKAHEENQLLKNSMVIGKVKSAIRSVDGLIKGAEDDIFDLYQMRFEVNDKDEVKDKNTGSYVMDASGARMKYQDHVSEYIKSKPQFLRANVGKGPSGEPLGSDNPGGVLVMTLPEWNEKMSGDLTEVAKYQKMMNEGKIKINDE